jgi:Kdo2-lipid IVA lauroyltransferase/acyltransferase
MKLTINLLVYLAVIPLIKLWSLLPFRVLYVFSNLLFFFSYNLFGYRKKVVLTNLKNSFPHLSEKEILTIARKFYLHLCDLIVETSKLAGIAQKEIEKRCIFSDRAATIFSNLHQEQKSFFVVMGHYGNWEWAGIAMSLFSKHRLNVIYKPLSNIYFDQLVYSIRSRFGARPVASANILRVLIEDKNKLTATAFIADQSPNPENAQWLDFLNQETAFFTGIEKMAVKTGYPVVFASVIKNSRGFYTVDAELLTNDPKALLAGELTKMHVQKLEAAILKFPEFWLWSHRRWKHKKEKNQ